MIDDESDELACVKGENQAALIGLKHNTAQKYLSQTS